MKNKKNRRPFIQGGWTLLTNAHLSGYWTGKIYQGPLKKTCVPGLNCYSCPGALGSCPLGTLQNSLYDPRQKIPFYILGILVLIGTILGRAVCGLLCPFGFLQDLLSKIPVKKYHPEKEFPALDRGLRRVKWLNLFGLVILFPLMGQFVSGFAAPWFCKLVCPAGTVGAGWPMLALNESLRPLAGTLFSWKCFVAVLVLVFALFVPRFFCRYLCPLGALYGLFSRISLYRLRFEKSGCVNCGRCVKACPMGIDPREAEMSPECIRCGDCVYSCPTACLSCGFETKDTDRAGEIG